MSTCGVDPTIASQLVQDGWTTQSFACAALDLESFDRLWQDLFSDTELSLLQKASVRAANLARIKKRPSVMTGITGRTCLGTQYPTLEVREGDWVDVGDDADVENAELETKVQSLATEASKRVQSDETYKFFITVSRRAGHRRLHLVGCFVKPSNCCEVRLCNTVTAEEFDSICRACKKRMLQESGKDTPGESSSTASSCILTASSCILNRWRQ